MVSMYKTMLAKISVLRQALKIHKQEADKSVSSADLMSPERER